MVLPPNYLRAINVHNPEKASFSLVVTFKSGEVQTVQVTEALQKIERGIDHGSYTTVDAIINVTMKDTLGADISHSFDNVQGVQIFDFEYFLGGDFPDMSVPNQSVKHSQRGGGPAGL